MAISDLKSRIDTAFGRMPADLVVKNVTVLNVATGTQAVTDIAVVGDHIVGVYETYEGKKTIDGTGLFAVPGFGDAHLHIESSLLTPYELDRLALSRGTTFVVCDPHEAANVLDTEAFDYFLKAALGTAMDMYVQLSSCVPATSLETSGGDIGAKKLERYRDALPSLGLAEFMNLGGVAAGETDVLAKLDAFRNHHIDGHMPGVRGAFLNALMAVGIVNDHESTTLDEAREKLEKGLFLFLRQGTVCRDLETLWPLLTPQFAPRIGLCTDDRKPTDIARDGHIDYAIRRAIALGADVASTYRAATLSTAEHYGLRDRGLIAAGRRADIVLLSSLEECRVETVIRNGRVVDDAMFAARPALKHVGYGSVRVHEVHPDDFAVQSGRKNVDVIGIVEGKIISEAVKAELPTGRFGTITADPDQDILKLAVIERHGKGGGIGLGFVQGLGMKDGALASTVAHDHHNIIVAGANDADMAVAANRLRAIDGGFVVVRDGKVLAELPLPVAGLMSDQPYEAVNAALDVLNRKAAEICALPAPFMYLSFMGLCVIPTLKLTDKGLTRFDPAAGDQGPVLIRPSAPRPGA